MADLVKFYPFILAEFEHLKEEHATLLADMKTLCEDTGFSHPWARASLFSGCTRSMGFLILYSFLLDIIIDRVFRWRYNITIKSE